MRKSAFIARKELYHILRDPRSLIIIFAMPVLMTFLFGYAVNMDVDNVTLAVIDLDRTSESRALISQFYESEYFSAPQEDVSLEDPEQLLRLQDAAGVLIIRSGFAEAIARGESFALGMTVDGSDNILSAAVQAYSSGVVNSFMLHHAGKRGIVPAIAISPQIKYNPDLESSKFFIPALVALVLIMISALLTSITIAREKETGTMEQLLVAPVTAGEILFGKISPYVAIAFIDGMLVLLFAKVLFSLPFVGSLWLLGFFTMLYVTSALAIGILISSLVKTQQVAMMFALVTTMLPSVMLSGFLYTIKNMPLPLQIISNVVAAKYYMYAVRGILLKGSTLEMLAIQAIGLVLLMIAMMAVATKKFSTRIE